jgi:hypothetical protein
MTTPKQADALSQAVVNHLMRQLVEMIATHGRPVKSMADCMNAGVFDVSAALPGSDHGPFAGCKFKLTFSLMPMEGE